MSTNGEEHVNYWTLLNSRMPLPKKIKKYPPENMQRAVEAVHRGISVAAASREYQVPRITLLYKAKGKYPVNCRMGPETILTAEEEDLLVRWLLSLSDAGFPATRLQLLDSVQILVTKLNRPNSFKNNRPGKKWFRCFLMRHPQLSERLTQNLTKSRSEVSEEKIRKWFDEIQQYVETKNLTTVFNDPKRIFNTDETAFFLCPKGIKALIRRGDKTAYNFINNDEKECLTTLITANAAGMLVPPMIMFNYERIPAYISNLMPHGWGIGKSESGWMTGQSFYEFVANIFHPWIITNNIELPVVLFVDGHSSHLTMELSNFCTANRIELIALYPNATHILQPMDVAIFHPLKIAWKKGINKFKVTHEGMKLKRENFGPLLKEVIEQNLTPEMFKNGFRTCGFFPLNANAVPYHKYYKNASDTKTLNSSETRHNEIQMTKRALEVLESKIGKEKIDLFKGSDVLWKGDIKDTSLFLLWRAMSSEAETNENITDEIATIPEVQSEANGNELVQANNKTPVKEVMKKITIYENIIMHPATTSVNSDTDTPSTSGMNLNDLSCVPTPFKTSLFWPKLAANKKPKRAKDKVPSVATSDQWRSYHRKKQENKENKEREKEERKRKREQAKINKENERKKKLANNRMKRKNMKIKDQTSSDSSFSVCVESEGEGDNWADSPHSDEFDDFINEREQMKKPLKEISMKVPTKPEQEKGKRVPGKETKKGNQSIHAMKTDSKDEITLISDDNSKVQKPDCDLEMGDYVFQCNDYVIIKYNDSYYPGKIAEVRNNEYKISSMKSGILDWKWPDHEDIMWYEKGDIMKRINPPSQKNDRGIFSIPEMRGYSSIFYKL